jgi:hypothetical protein
VTSTHYCTATRQEPASLEEPSAIKIGGPATAGPALPRAAPPTASLPLTAPPGSRGSRKDGSLNAESSVLGNGKTGSKLPEISH